MLEEIKCRYCKKAYQACLFYKVDKKNMCNRCYPLYLRGKKHINGKWVGERKPVDKEVRKRYGQKYRLLKRFSTSVW